MPASLGVVGPDWSFLSDLDGTLERFFSPSLTDRERKVAEIEGWIQGIA